MAEHNLASEDAQKLKKQLEFYFGDSNYSRDKFLNQKAKENDGYIPIASLATFNKVKAITTDIGFLTAVLKTIEDLEVKDDGLMVKRKNPIPDQRTLDSRTIAVKDLSEDESVANVDTITEVFSKFGKVSYVQLRRNREKRSVGKAFIQYTTTEAAQKAVEAGELMWPSKPETKIKIKSKEQYESRRQEFLGKGGQQNQRQTPKRENKQRDNQNANDSEQSGGSNDINAVFVPGTMVVVTNIPQDIHKMTWKQFFASYGRVRYVDTDDSNKLIVRMWDAGSAANIVKAIADKKVEMQSKVLEGTAMAGDEERKYWEEKVLPNLKKPQQQKGQKRKHGGGRGGNYNKRRRTDENIPEAKNENTTEVKNENTTQVKTEATTQVKSEPTTEVKN